MLSSSIESFFGSFSLFSDDWRLEEATKTVLLAVLWSVSRVQQRSAAQCRHGGSAAGVGEVEPLGAKAG